MKLRKIISSKLVKISFVAIFVLTAVSAIPRHLGPKMYCGEYEGRLNVYVQREQHGFPLVLAKRSISSSSCSSWSEDYKDEAPNVARLLTFTNPDKQHEILDNGYIIVLNALLDLAFWGVIAYLFVTFYDKKNAGRNKDK